MSPTVSAAKSDAPKIGALQMWIDGKPQLAESGNTITLIDPSTGDAIGSVPAGGAADVDRAVRVAHRSFESGVWRALHPGDRARVLWRAADMLEARGAEIAHLEALDSGMLLGLAQALVGASAATLRYYAGAATKVYGAVGDVSGPMGAFHAYTRKEPIGVCAMITPWNFPLNLAIAKLAPALAVGCSCVLKPSEEAPASAILMAQIFEEAGLPPGVLNIVTGVGPEAGEALVKHPMVAKIAFTGSTAVGKSIVRHAADGLKRVTLELGGKSPVIVFDDADIDAAVAGAAMGVFARTGQVCVAGSRVYVQRKSYDRVAGALASIAKSMKLGPALDAASEMGPLISARQKQRVMEKISAGLDSGAELLAGGRAREGAGYFVEPTVLARPAAESAAVREEIFGPVVSVFPFDTEEEAIALANDTTYGLAAAVWTRDVRKTHAIAAKLEAGLVWSNCCLVNDVALPYGGFKQSGLGREFGPDGVEAYLETKTVVVSLN